MLLQAQVVKTSPAFGVKDGEFEQLAVEERPAAALTIWALHPRLNGGLVVVCKQTGELDAGWVQVAL